MLSEILSKLTPAETHYIANFPKGKIQDFVRLTFSDLLLKQVLYLSAEQGIEDSSFVCRGKQFLNYKPLKHETILTQPFTEDATLNISLMNLIKIAYEKIRGTDYKYYYLYSERLASYFKQNILLKGIGLRVLNKEGLVLQQKIREFFSTIEREVEAKQFSIEHIANKVLPIKGNILLLPTLDASLVEEMYQLQQKPSEGEAYDFGAFYRISTKERKEFDPSGVIEFLQELFESLTDTMDTVSTSDAGGGDSGCSGCGGCGG